VQANQTAWIQARIKAAIAKALQEGKQGIHRIAATHGLGMAVLSQFEMVPV